MPKRLRERLRGRALSALHLNWWQEPRDFVLDGHRYELFCHRYNCGWPPGRMTERSVELAIADSWLSEREGSRICEIGAVTPYYWPGRIKTIVDPVDPHQLISHRRPVSEVGLSGYAVLSISTFEHIGTGDYELEHNADELNDAFDQVIAEASDFLITVPIGYNEHCDEYVARLDREPRGNISTFFLARVRGGNTWAQAALPFSARYRYDTTRQRMSTIGAEAIAVVMRSGSRPAIEITGLDEASDDERQDPRPSAL